MKKFLLFLGLLTPFILFPQEKKKEFKINASPSFLEKFFKENLEKNGNYQNFYRKSRRSKDISDVREFFIHFSLGLGLDWFKSNDIDNFMYPFEISPLGYYYNFSIKIGYQNIVQLEKRYSLSLLHNFMYENEDQIEMELNFEEFIIKFNPFFEFPSKVTRFDAFYFYAGFGDASFKDEEGSGFFGKDLIIGLEECISLKKWGENCWGIEYRHINYDKFKIVGEGTLLIDNKAYQICLFWSGAIGFGY